MSNDIFGVEYSSLELLASGQRHGAAFVARSFPKTPFSLVGIAGQLLFLQRQFAKEAIAPKAVGDDPDGIDG
jgi:hypothetical protein